MVFPQVVDKIVQRQLVASDPPGFAQVLSWFLTQEIYRGFEGPHL